MLNIKEIINEEIEALDGLAWLQDSTAHIRHRSFPFTKALGAIMNDSRRVTTFHVSNVDSIGYIKEFVGKDVAISTFKFMQEYRLKSMDGIQTDGGIIYQMTGDLIIDSTSDIMSRPDDQGRRWIDIEDYVPRKVREIFRPIKQEWIQHLKTIPRFSDLEAKNGTYGLSITEDEKNEFINLYISESDKFLQQYKTELADAFIDVQSSDNWNEMLITNIEVVDVLWTIIRTGWYSDYVRLSEYEYKLNDDEQKELDGYNEYVNKMRTDLESFITGTAYFTTTTDEAIKFIEDRGGFTDSNKYMTNVINNNNHSE